MRILVILGQEIRYMLRSSAMPVNGTGSADLLFVVPSSTLHPSSKEVGNPLVSIGAISTEPKPLHMRSTLFTWSAGGLYENYAATIVGLSK